MPLTAVLSTLLLSLSCTATAVFFPPVAPPGYYQPIAPIKPNIAHYNCLPGPVPFTTALQFSSKYEGSRPARDQLNVAAQKSYEDAKANISRLEKESVKIAQDYVTGKVNSRARDCLLARLTLWAEKDALLSTNSNHTGKSVRKWALASVASAYLTIKSPRNAPGIEARQQELIDQWLSKIAYQVRSDWSNRPVEKRNNHDYWAAWSVMVTSALVNDPDLFKWARRGLANGLAQINDQGYLSNEMKRKTRALTYHNFALQPLAMLAVFAEHSDSKLTNAERVALSKLVTATVNGINEPRVFKQLTGSVQNQQGLRTSYALAWMEPYAAYFGEYDLLLPYLQQFRPMKSTRMGGDMTRLFGTELPDSVGVF